MNGYEALRAGAACLDLSARGKIRVTGEDRARLLHAMSTNHVAGLQPNEGLYAFFLTAVGRVLADAYIYNLGDALFLDTEPEVAEKLFKHLDGYIIADDAFLEDETARLSAIGIEGPRSIEHVNDLGWPVPVNVYSTAPFRKGFIARVSSTGSDGLRVFLPTEETASFLADLNLPAASADEARVVRLENGRPRYGDEITERYLLQETQQLHAAHFSKGCYLGQEIVERVRSRGQVHRVLKAIQIPGASVPAPGTVLMQGTEKKGEIASAAYSPARREVVGLAYVRTDAGDALNVLGSDSPALVRHI